MGTVYKTDVLKYLDKNESRMFNINVDTEIRASFFTIMEERLHIEVSVYDLLGKAMGLE
jgi:hypothetical protein